MTASSCPARSTRHDRRGAAPRGDRIEVFAAGSRRAATASISPRRSARACGLAQLCPRRRGDDAGRRARSRGAQLAIAGDVPHGGGLSSSASLEVAVALALAGAVGPSTRSAPTRPDRAARRKRVRRLRLRDHGPVVVGAGAAGHALLIDCRSLELRQSRCRTISRCSIVDSGRAPRQCRRRLRCSGGANAKRAARHYGVAALRDLDAEALERGAAVSTTVLFRRARHVVTENARVLAAADALRSRRPRWRWAR